MGTFSALSMTMYLTVPSLTSNLSPSSCTAVKIEGYGSAASCDTASGGFDKACGFSLAKSRSAEMSKRPGSPVESMTERSKMFVRKSAKPVSV